MASNHFQSFRTVALSSALLVSTFGITTSASADVMLGASLPNDGFSREVIADFNNLVPTKLAYVNVFSAFSHDWDNLYWQSKNVVAEGATPMISWMPIDLQRPDDNLLPEIAIGMWDEYLDLWGTKLLAWVNMYPASEKPRLAIRFAHEFNGNWYPYSNTPFAYAAAWQHIHDKFAAMGVNEHVDWVWSASKTNVDDYDNFSIYYPGDEYVDWTSLDGYNWGSNYTPNGWSTFGEIFNNAYLHMVNDFPDKPIMIAETGSAEPSDLPNTAYGMYGDDSDAEESKPAWITDMLVHIETEYPAVRALSLFNINKELGWSIDKQTNTGMDAWIDGMQSQHFTSDLIIASAPQAVYGMQSVAVMQELESVQEFTDALEVSAAESIATIQYEAADEPVPDVVSTKNKGNKESKSEKISKHNKTSTLLAETAQPTLETDTVVLGIASEKRERRLDANKQRQLAKSKKPKKMNPEKGRLFAEKMRSLSPQERKQLRKMKMAVIDY